MNLTPKPCPKCGSKQVWLISREAVLPSFAEKRRGLFYRCSKHMCYFEGDIKGTREEALVSWNEIEREQQDD